ncbi:MAG: 2-oxoacid:acceptor oxidoreductase family protein [Gammaproteobacteria bacterium]|nr:2-oxoacid:acceptor oxidoreductase family protein [Gammaproteobacteria bacterium]
MYRIRFHGRGGQGMKTASRILGTALFLEGYEIQDAPRYGAERRGAPIFAYVRADKKTINERGIITRPDLIIVADDSLIPVPAAGVLAGIVEHTVLLINSDESEQTWQHRLNIRNKIITLPVETEDRAELRFIGATCTGAASRLLGIISLASLEQAIKDELAELGPQIIDKNIHKAKQAYEKVAPNENCVSQGSEITAGKYLPPDWIDLPFEAAHISAPNVWASATSMKVNTGVWRTLRPIIDYERCNKCWWVCSTFCPDSAITVDESGQPHIDYDHCKGCMICVAQCPPHAIETISEQEAAAQDKLKEEETTS